MKEHKGAVRRQEGESLLTFHCLTTGHAFDWGRATVVGKGTSKFKREFVEAWNTTSTCVNQSMEEANAYTTTIGSLVPKLSCQHCIIDIHHPPPLPQPFSPPYHTLISFHTCIYFFIYPIYKAKLFYTLLYCLF